MDQPFEPWPWPLRTIGSYGISWRKSPTGPPPDQWILLRVSMEPRGSQVIGALPHRARADAAAHRRLLLQQRDGEAVPRQSQGWADGVGTNGG